MELGLVTYNYKIGKGFLDYEFYSEGPKGRIKKIVRFTPQNAGGITYFNLGFGDWNTQRRKIDDRIITNNHDKDKILATVAAAVLEFIRHFPDAIVYIKGSSRARTRLYQMGISTNWKEIQKLVSVYGYSMGNGWQPFQKNINYEAFMASRK